MNTFSKIIIVIVFGIISITSVAQAQAYEPIVIVDYHQISCVEPWEGDLSTGHPTGAMTCAGFGDPASWGTYFELCTGSAFGVLVNGYFETIAHCYNAKPAWFDLINVSGGYGPGIVKTTAPEIPLQIQSWLSNAEIGDVTDMGNGVYWEVETTTLVRYEFLTGMVKTKRWSLETLEGGRVEECYLLADGSYGDCDIVG